MLPSPDNFPNLPLDGLHRLGSRVVVGFQFARQLRRLNCKPMPQEVERLFPGVHHPRLLSIECQPKSVQNLLSLFQIKFWILFAQNHKVIRVPHDVSIMWPFAERLHLPRVIQPMQVKIRQQGRNNPSLRRSGGFPPETHIFHHTSRQPHFDQFHNRPINDLGPYRQQQLVVRDRIEIRLQIRINNPVTLEVQPLVDFAQGLLGALARPEAIRKILEARLEYWLDDEFHCCLHYTICNDRNAQRSLRSVGLGDVHPSDRHWPVPLFDEPCPNFV
ncbi:hypothetical protein BvCmsKSP083_03031 [Escherichia coli]|nr:hypothetical protein BvCmsKSP083_03031 [Escherichia coli]